MNPIKKVSFTLFFPLSMLMVNSSMGTIISLNPSQDNSIYSESDNSSANGVLFTGQTLGGAVRRALMQFDVAGSGIPAGSTINSVSLKLSLVKVGPAQSSAFELHPLTATWGEGTSVGGPGTGGSPTTGDSTWNYRLYNSTPWTAPGGDFGATSGTTTFNVIGPTYTFGSQSGMVADVQQWLDTPATNFGWLLKAANESSNISAQSLGSKESGVQQPSLSIDYTAPSVPEPASLGLCGIAGISILRRRLNR